jgi:hypothetical protein
MSHTSHPELSGEDLTLLPGIKSVLDLLNGFVAEVGEADGVGSLGHGVALVELASDDGGQSHASRGNTGDEDSWQTTSLAWPFRSSDLGYIYHQVQ